MKSTAAGSPPMTIVQKTISRKIGREHVAPGEVVTLSPDYTVMQELYFFKNIETLKRLGIPRVSNPEKVIAVADHTPQAAMGTIHGRRYGTINAFVKETGFPNYFGPGRAALRHLVLVEQGFARPGTVIFSDEGNIASIGALGALSIPMSWEVLVTMIEDSNWIRVPESVSVELSGSLPFGVTARDAVQHLNMEHSRSGDFVQACIEFHGEGIQSLSLDDRQTILAGMYHCGADTSIMEIDDRVIEYVESRAEGRPYEPITADARASYRHSTALDLSSMHPYVTLPPTHDQVVRLPEIAGKSVTHSMIGSCGSNRIDDLRAAAEILRGRKVNKDVTMYITPGSPEIYSQAASEGLLEIFSNAGASVLTPSCSTCWGYLGTLSDGDVAITTHQEHYKGRMGSREAEVLISGPYVAAAAAVAGQLIDPRELL